RVDAVYVHFFMQKWGEERIFPHPNIYYRTFFIPGFLFLCSAGKLDGFMGNETAAGIAQGNDKDSSQSG
ncbi:hypothetical protein HMPREF1479_01985, partial [Acidaminococcus sp. HPA0509]